MAVASPLLSSSLTCSIGQLTGTWRIHYVETSGTCGPLADATTNGPTPWTTPPCNPVDDVAPDRCTDRFTSSCAQTVNGASAVWNVSGDLTQTSETQLVGTARVDATSPRACSSTYALTVSRME